jgi:hypothetical protein
MPRTAAPLMALLAVLLTLNAMAGVLQKSESGFMVRNKAGIHAAPDSVYTALARCIDRWWDPAHTYSGDSRNLTLDARPGGCFCEALPDGGGVRHLEVVFVSPGKTLRMTGALGPLQASGLAGSLTWSFRAEGDSTMTDVTYSVGGNYEGGLEQIAPVVDRVLREQLLRLKSYVETGKPAR